MTAEEYRTLLVSFRKQQLQDTAANVQRLAAVFDAAVAELVSRLENLSEGSLREEFTSALIGDLQSRLNALRDDYALGLEAARLELAQNAANRETATASLFGLDEDTRLSALETRTFTFSSGSEVRVQFGQVAASAVERTALRVWSDGYTLNARLAALDKVTRDRVADTIVQGVAEQLSAKSLAKRLEETLATAGEDNPRYKAMRIARTEINASHREAHILSTQRADGTLKDYILAVGWRLSQSHPKADICDLWAGDDGDGLGAGNYLPANVPTDHPHGLCYTVTVLKEFPEVSAPGKKPVIDEVAESQVRYYAEQGDPVALRRLEALS
jgi:hypothetical protein